MTLGPRTRISPATPRATSCPASSTHARLAQQRRRAGRTHLSHGIVPLEHDRRRRGLGGAVDLPHRHAARMEGRISSTRHDRRAAMANAQLERSVVGPARMLDQRRIVAGTSSVASGRQVAIPSSTASGSKRGCSRTVAPAYQRRQRLDVEPADMEHRQERENEIVRPSKSMRVDRRSRIRHQRRSALCTRALRPPVVPEV